MPQLAGKGLQNNMRLYRVIGDNVKELRKLVQITQEQLGRAIGVSHDTIHHIETSKCRTEIALIKEIADIFQITTDDICSTELSMTDLVDKELVKKINAAFYPKKQN